MSSPNSSSKPSSDLKGPSPSKSSSVLKDSSPSKSSSDLKGPSPSKDSSASKLLDKVTSDLPGIPSEKYFKLFSNEKIVSGSKEFLESNSFVAKLAFLLLVIFVFVILLRLGITALTYLFSFSKDPVLIDGMIDSEQLLVIAQNPNTPGSKPILRSQNQRDGLEFTWSVWLWIKNPPLSSNPAAKPNQYKHVFNKGNDNVGANGIVTPNNGPGLYIGPNYRELVVIMNTFDNLKEEITIGDIPIEKWINVIIRCDQHKLDLYINGTLARSHILKGVPKQNYDNVYAALNGGFAGYTSSLRYFARAINIKDINNIITTGPNLKMKSKSLKDSLPYYLSFRWFFPKQSDAISF
jgi:hypothetical protein